MARENPHSKSSGKTPIDSAATAKHKAKIGANLKQKMPKGVKKPKATGMK